MNRISWIDKKEYPFNSNYFETQHGKMHFVDEGNGDPIVMVHGNPTWSFLYRHLIKDLSKKYRCIAPDHLGFGLSDKPADWSYLPQNHAENLDALINHLGLKNITLVVQDWGGPIGLSYAVNNPDNIKRIIIINTWMWSVSGDHHFEKFSGLMGGKIGTFLIRNFNFFAKVVMKKAYGDKNKLTKHLHRHYILPLKNPIERKGTWIFPKEIIGSTNWLESLWLKSENIKDKPALLLWGMKDIAFREKELNTWITLFTNHKVFKFDEVGHYVQEEMGPGLVKYIDSFLSELN